MSQNDEHPTAAYSRDALETELENHRAATANLQTWLTNSKTFNDALRKEVATVQAENARIQVALLTIYALAKPPDGEPEAIRTLYRQVRHIASIGLYGDSPGERTAVFRDPTEWTDPPPSRSAPPLPSKRRVSVAQVAELLTYLPSVGMAPYMGKALAAVQDLCSAWAEIQALREYIETVAVSDDQQRGPLQPVLNLDTTLRDLLVAGKTLTDQIRGDLPPISDQDDDDDDDQDGLAGLLSKADLEAWEKP